MSERLDGRLSEGEMTALDDHLQRCASCRARWQVMQRLSLLLQSAELAAPPPDFTARVIRQLQARDARRLRAQRQESVPAPMWALAAVIIALLWLVITAFAAGMPVQLSGDATIRLSAFSLSMSLSDAAIRVATVIDMLLAAVVVIGRHVPLAIALAVAAWIMLETAVLFLLVGGLVSTCRPAAQAIRQANSVKGGNRT